MNNFEELIAKYEAVLPDSKKEEFGKVRVIEMLEYFEDARVLPFFLKVLVDETDYDLARVEITKILRIRKPKNQKEKQDIAQSLMLVLKNSETDDNYLVRQYAAMAIDKYSDIEGVFECAAEIILNTDEDINVRYNVLDVFERDGSTERTLKIFKELLKDEEFQKTANRILKEWNQYLSV